MKGCQHCIVSGSVQGVFFRRGTQKKAKELGISGWVRNLPNGDVECLVCGDTEQVQKMIAWLEVGPTAAKVSEVRTQEVMFEDHMEFTVK